LKRKIAPKSSRLPKPGHRVSQSSARNAELWSALQHEAQANQRPRSRVAVLVSPETERPSTVPPLYQKKARDNMSLALGHRKIGSLGKA